MLVNTACRPWLSPLLGEQVHLQEALVRALLHVDQVRDRRACVGMREKSLRVWLASWLACSMGSYLAIGRDPKE